MSSVDPMRNRISISFPGGSVDEYVKVVRAASEEANVIVLGDAGSLRLPSFELRGVDVALAMELLNRQIHAPALYAQGMAPNAIPLISVEVIHTPVRPGLHPAHVTPGAPIITINAHAKSRASSEHDAEAEPEPEELYRSVESIGPLVNRGLIAEDILDALQSTLVAADLAGGETRIAYHEQTQLLMITATLDGVEAIQDTLAALKHSIPRHHLPATERSDTPAELDELRRNNQALRNTVEDLDRALRATQAELMEMQRRGTPGATGGAPGAGGAGAGGAAGSPGERGGARGGAGGEGGSGTGGRSGGR